MVLYCANKIVSWHGMSYLIRTKNVFVLSCFLGSCAGFVLSSRHCGALWGVDGVFFFPVSPCFFCFFVFVHPPSLISFALPSPFLYHLMPAHLIFGCWYVWFCPTPSSPPPHSLLSPHPLPLHLLMEPLPPSLAGTPCRTVWRRSIRQSNPESLLSGHSGDRWVTRGDDSGARPPVLLLT